MTDKVDNSGEETTFIAYRGEKIYAITGDYEVEIPYESVDWYNTNKNIKKC